jgi:nucleotide-binding universal stress UspA family protein
MSLPASRTHPSLNSVLLATDLSETSQKALCHAVAIARHYRAKFYFTHVVSGLVCRLTGPQALELASEAAEREVLQVNIICSRVARSMASITNSSSAKASSGKNCNR